MIDIVDEIRNDPAKGARRLEAEYRAGLFTLARRLCQDDGERNGANYLCGANTGAAIFPFSKRGANAIIVAFTETSPN